MTTSNVFCDNTLRPPGRLVIIGLGNPIMSDDGVGPIVALRVAERLGIVPDVLNDGPIEVRQSFAGGIRLIDDLVGFDRAVIIDAVLSGKEPIGTVYHQTIKDELFTRNSASLHDTDLPTALEMMRLAGEKVPDQIEIFGIEAESVYECGKGLSPSVAAALPELIEEIVGSVSSAVIGYV